MEAFLKSLAVRLLPGEVGQYPGAGPESLDAERIGAEKTLQPERACPKGIVAAVFRRGVGAMRGTLSEP